MWQRFGRRIADGPDISANRMRRNRRRPGRRAHEGAGVRAGADVGREVLAVGTGVECKEGEAESRGREGGWGLAQMS